MEPQNSVIHFKPDAIFKTACGLVITKGVQATKEFGRVTCPECLRKAKKGKR